MAVRKPRTIGYHATGDRLDRPRSTLTSPPTLADRPRHPDRQPVLVAGLGHPGDPDPPGLLGPPRGSWSFAVMRIWANGVLAASRCASRSTARRSWSRGRATSSSPTTRACSTSRCCSRPPRAAADDGQADPVPDPHLRLGAEGRRLHLRRPRRPQHRHPELLLGVRPAARGDLGRSSSPRAPARSTTRSSPSSAAASCSP